MLVVFAVVAVAAEADVAEVLKLSKAAVSASDARSHCDKNSDFDKSFDSCLVDDSHSGCCFVRPSLSAAYLSMIVAPFH